MLHADKARVPDAAKRVPHSDLGKTSSPSGRHDKQVRVWRVRGQPGPSLCCMPQVWETPGQGSRSGEDTRQSVPGSRSSGSPKRQVARHEHHGAREIEVLASGLPTHHGAQLAVDITLRSAVNASGGHVRTLPL